MTVFRNWGFYTFFETGIFYCWSQLPAVVVRLVFWLALSPSEDKVVAWKSQAVVRLRRNHFTKCFAKRLPNRSGIRCMVCILLAWEKTPRPWPYFFFLPAPLLSNISWLNRLSWRRRMLSEGRLHWWSRCPSDEQSGCQFPLHFHHTQPITFKFYDGAMVMTSWRWAGMRPILDAISKQRNREYHRMSRTIVQFCPWYDCCRPVY